MRQVHPSPPARGARPARQREIHVAGTTSRASATSTTTARGTSDIVSSSTTSSTLNALENVQVPMFELGIGAAERRERAARLLELVGLSERERSRPAQLSGGERQRVAVARALANDPAVLLADEPTGSLDSEAGRNVLDLLERIRRERRMTLVLVTHDLAVAERADRIVRILDGRLDDRPAPVLALGRPTLQPVQSYSSGV
jgi:predicted ABC-type transport system involved in lysophospholipase L1 biosynthesis ATPase subunit